jgi:histidine triad (HIT) family protein
MGALYQNDKHAPTNSLICYNHKMNNCIFCKIIKKEIPAHIVYEDDSSLAFLDIHPVSYGHTLLIPKEHHEKILSTPDSLVSNLFVTAKKLTPAVREATNADFIALTVVGEDVPHFHIHLIPRSEGDGLAGFWPTKEYESEDAKKIIAASVKSNL